MHTRKIFPPTKVLVIGDIMLDRYIHGTVERISPEAPVPVLLQEHMASHPGGAANVAVNLHHLGAAVYLAGVIGKDPHGAALIESLKSEPIDLHYLLIANRKTTTKTRKGVLTSQVIRTTIAQAKKVGAFIAVDPKYRHFFEYTDVDLFKPNERELYRALESAAVHGDGLRESVKELQRRLDARYLAVTLADRGMLMYDGQVMHHVPTRPRSIRDVCGAGDAVLSVLALSLYHGYDVVSAAQMANAAGGLVCERPGVCPVPIIDWIREVRGLGIFTE